VTILETAATMATPVGEIAVVGLGPGPAGWLVPEAAEALDLATDLVGYIPYVARVPERPGLLRHASDNRVEIDRARHAFQLALEGRRVAVVSGGDPGVFAMAAAVFEALESDPACRAVPVRVVPGLSAMQAAAARLGAPLGHDFCAISLSPNLKPWAVVLRRLQAAAEGDFVMALYNPASRARPLQIGQAFDHLRGLKAAATPVAFARAVGRPDERLHLTTLGEAAPALVDMATLVIVGSSETRLVAGQGGRRWMLTPRSYGAVPSAEPAGSKGAPR
jgi:precorrin-3B C17-methyltransferase